jgi:hypothetical protein
VSEIEQIATDFENAVRGILHDHLGMSYRDLGHEEAVVGILEAAAAYAEAVGPLIRADERRRIAAGIHVGEPDENVPAEERLGLYRLAAADGVLAERERWQAKLDAIRALLTSGPVGRASGERYIRADLIRDVLDAQPEHLTETEPEQQ